MKSYVFVLIYLIQKELYLFYTDERCVILFEEWILINRQESTMNKLVTRSIIWDVDIEKMDSV